MRTRKSGLCLRCGVTMKLYSSGKSSSSAQECLTAPPPGRPRRVPGSYGQLSPCGGGGVNGEGSEEEEKDLEKEGKEAKVPLTLQPRPVSSSSCSFSSSSSSPPPSPLLTLLLTDLFSIPWMLIFLLTAVIWRWKEVVFCSSDVKKLSRVRSRHPGATAA